MKKLNGKSPDMRELYYDSLYGVTPEMWESVKPVLKKDGLLIGIMIYGT